jgi:hypothetical protein
MRLYVSILAALGFTLTACGKKAEKPAEPAKTEPAKTEPAKTEPAKTEPTAQADAAAPAAADAQAAAADVAPTPAPDRIAAIQTALEAIAAGKAEDAAATFADDATWYNVGAIAAEVKGKPAIIEALKVSTGLAELKVKANRIIEAGDFVSVEYVTAGKLSTKAEDGTESTKDVAFPTALLLQFNAEGKVTTAWHVRDDINLGQQLGQTEGLVEGFKTVAFPETTEVVKGEGNAAIKDLYIAFAGKVATAETIDAAVTEHVADTFSMVDFDTGATVDKAGMGAALKAQVGALGGWTVSVDNAFFAGEYGVLVVTHKAAYKGGIPGVEAKDQALTWTSLEVVQVKEGKLASVSSYTNPTQNYVTLGLIAAGAAEKPAEGAVEGSTGIAVCDTYIKAVTACAEKLPEAARPGALEGLKTMQTQVKDAANLGDAAKGPLETACKQALDASKNAMASMCPDVSWE